MFPSCWNVWRPRQLRAGTLIQGRTVMRIFTVAAATALLVFPTLALASPAVTDVSSQGIEIGPGGVRVDDGRRRSERRGLCAELRAACLNKERLGEQGEGNCRRYRRTCR